MLHLASLSLPRSLCVKPETSKTTAFSLLGRGSAKQLPLQSPPLSSREDPAASEAFSKAIGKKQQETIYSFKRWLRL